MTKATIKPFYNQNGYTEFNNYVLDYIMPSLSPNAWKVLCFIMRKTKGWQKEQDQLSFSQIMECTGIKNRTTVNNAINELENGNYVNVIHSDDRVTSNTYSLNTDLEINLGSTEIVLPSTEIVLPKLDEVVQKSYSQKKVVDLDNNTREKTITWTLVYNRWFNQFGHLDKGQSDLLQDYFDENSLWAFKAINETIAHNPDEPFPYFKRIIDGWIKLGHIPERDPAKPPAQKARQYNGNGQSENPTTVDADKLERYRELERQRLAETAGATG